MILVFSVLPHCQLSSMRIFANQRLEDLIVVITPVIDGTGINVFVQFFPVRGYDYAGSTFFQR